jgi:hypothetical protein
MLGSILIAAALAGIPSPVHPAGTETAIPRMRDFLEWVADGKQGLYIRGDTGKWYYAHTEVPCARLRPHTSISFVGARANQLDRYGSIVVEGWRCPLDSVVASGSPPSFRKRHP